jgi:ketosteroid isomerase-like protein
MPTRGTFMKISAVASIAMLCGLSIAPAAMSQEWTPAQTEVWKNVENYWAQDAAGDLEGFLSNFHENYIGWDLNDPVTSNKSVLRKYLDHSYKTEKTVLHDIRPVSINIVGDVAVVHYYYNSISKGTDGKEIDRSGRWADILVKQDGKWVLIGDHGGSTSDDDN